MTFIEALNNPATRAMVENCEELRERSERYNGKDTITEDMLSDSLAELKLATGIEL